MTLKLGKQHWLVMYYNFVQMMTFGWSWPTIFILINAPFLINAPSHFLMEKYGQMPPKVADTEFLVHWAEGS